MKKLLALLLLILVAGALGACNFIRTPAVTETTDAIDVKGEAGTLFADLTEEECEIILLTYTKAADLGYDGTLSDFLKIVKGEKGEDGRGVSRMDIIDGELRVTYTDGTSEELGNIIGAQGPQGEKGDTGAQGPQGEKGDTGVGIANMEIDEDGNLVVYYTDAPTVGVVIGKVVGPPASEPDHTYGEWIVLIQPTAYTAGMRARVCSDCGKTEVAIIDRETPPALGHDETTVLQMNTILAAEGATRVITVLDLFDVLSENGIKAEEYTPLTEDRFFFWDSVENAIVYVDAEYNVLYPEDMKDSDKANWISLNGKIGDADLDDFVDEAEAAVTVTSPEQLVALITAISKGDTAVAHVNTINLEAGETYNVMGAEFQIDTLNKALTINGNGATIKGIVNNAAARDASVSASGTDRAYQAGIIAAVRKDLTIENLTIEGASIGDVGISQVGVVGAIYGGVTVAMKNVDIRDTTLIGMQKVGAFVGFMAAQSNNAPTLIIDADCSAVNVTVQAVAGLNGGIFGALDKEGTTVKVAEAAMANINVTVELRVIGEDNYLTVGDVKYGIDRNDDLTPFKGTIAVGAEAGYLKYYRANAKYGFTLGANTAITDANGQVLGLDGIKAASRSGAVDVALPAVTAGYYVFAK